MDFAAKIVLFEGDLGFFGPGVRDLFRCIDSRNSVKAACEEMQMSYSKAWKMIRNVEKAIGKQAVVRSHGGSDGGSAHLTEAGRDLLERYERFEKQCNNGMKELFNQEFSDIDNK